MNIHNILVNTFKFLGEGDDACDLYFDAAFHISIVNCLKEYYPIQNESDKKLGIKKFSTKYLYLVTISDYSKYSQILSSINFDILI